MTVTPTSIKQRFPEFTTLDDSYIQIFIDSAALNSNQSILLSAKDHAQSYLTAHLIKLSQRAGIPGSVKKEKVGDLSREHSSSNSNGHGLDSTGYGQEYKRMLKTTSYGPLII